MSTILVNKIKSYTGDTVTISGSNVVVQGKTVLGDGAGSDHVTVRAKLGITGSLDVSGSLNLSSGTSVLFVNHTHAALSNVTGTDLTLGNNLISSRFNATSWHFGSDSGPVTSSITTRQAFQAGNITSSAGIGAIGRITASSFESSGEISASGVIFGASDIRVIGSATFGDTNPGDLHTFVGQSKFAGSITASSHISASGIIIANLPTSEAAALPHGLYTLSGSQIFSSSAFYALNNPNPHAFLAGSFSSSLWVFSKA